MDDLSETQVHAAASDPAAMDALYRRYRGDVWAYAVRRCPGSEDAADLVADVFVAAVVGAAGFDARRGRPVAWLLGIAARRLADQRRRQAREGRALRAAGGGALLAPDERTAVEQRIDAHRRAAGLADALAQLTPAERDVLDLVSVHDLTPREAAAVLGIQPVAARVRLARARARLTRADAPPSPPTHEPTP